MIPGRAFPWVLAAGLLAAGPIWAQTSPQSAHDDGLSFGGSSAGQAQNAAKSSASVGAVPGYAGTNPSQTQYQSGNMYDAAVSAAQDTTTYPGQAASLIQGSFATRPQITVSKSDSWLQPGQQAIANPQTVPGISGQYGDCQTVNGPGYTSPDIRTCDVYYTETTSQCSTGVNVNVTANWQYDCTETRNSYTQTCTRTLNATYSTTAGVVETWTTTCP